MFFNRKPKAAKYIFPRYSNPVICKAAQLWGERLRSRLRSEGHVCIFSRPYIDKPLSRVNLSPRVLWGVCQLLDLFVQLCAPPKPLPHFLCPQHQQAVSRSGIGPGNTPLTDCSTLPMSPGFWASPGQLFQVPRSTSCLLIKPAKQPWPLRHCGPDTSWNVLHHP